MAWDGFLDELERWLRQRELLTSRARWVLGVSGGPDSTLLLLALSELSRRSDLQWELHVAHLHHGLRMPDADEDQDYVARLAERLGLPFHSERADIAADVAAGRGSTEEVARQSRYRFLERVSLRTGSELAAVAHHADDNAETVLHRICRGTGLRGLAGMREIRAIQPGSRVRLVRPFLSQRRATIEQLCRELELSPRIDASNETQEFTRGRIRNVVLPAIRAQVNPNVSEALLRLAEQASWLGGYLSDAAERTFDSLVVVEAPRQIVLNVRALLAKQRIIQAEVVRRAMSLVLEGEQDLSFAHIDAVLKLASELESGKEVHLPGPVLVRKVYDRLEFRPLTETTEAPELHSVYVRCPGVTAIHQLGLSLQIDVCPVTQATIDELRDRPHPHEEWVDLDRVRQPLAVRGRREGDRIWPLGAPGSKSLSEFLSDEKVDPALRARIGILCDQEGPVWVIPLRIDERCKLRRTSAQALRIRVTPLNSE